MTPGTATMPADLVTGPARRGSARGMGKSKTHVIAVFKHDNGELGEDIRPGLDQLPPESLLDDEIAASFPASDPSSHWAGESAKAVDQGVVRVPAERVVTTAAVEDVTERDNPADPVPRTLPR